MGNTITTMLDSLIYTALITKLNANTSLVGGELTNVLQIQAACCYYQPKKGRLTEKQYSTVRKRHRVLETVVGSAEENILSGI